MTEPKSYHCAYCGCTVRSIARGGTGVLATVAGRYVLVHAPCKRLHETKR